MKSAITICLVPEAKAGPFVFHEGLADGCQSAERHGFDAVEVFPPNGNAIELQSLAGLLSKHRLQLAAVGTGAGWLRHHWSLTSTDPEVRIEAMQFIEEIIDFAGGLGAPAILGSMQGRVAVGQTRADALQLLNDGLNRLSERALRHGQVLLYEPLNRYETNLFNMQAEAANWLDEQSLTNVKILADLFHMNIEEASLPETLRAIHKKLGHIHFADSNRRAIGMGHTSLPEIVDVLKEIGYEGYLSAEIFPLPDADLAAKETLSSFRKAKAMLTQ